MNSHLFPIKRTFLVAMLAGLVLLATAAVAVGAPGSLRSLLAPAASPPAMISYQGVVKVSGVPYNGAGYFKFAVVDAATGNGAANYWANDGTASGEPSASVSLAVTGGLFDVMLGDTSLTGMTQAVSQSVFNPTDTWLRVWFSQTAGGPFQALDPNQRIGSVAYALRAERALTADIAVGVGNNTNTCTAGLAGNLRWAGSAFEICDGSAWTAIQVGASVSKPVVLYQANNSVSVPGFVLGGRSGADSRCSTASNRPAGYSRYRAFLSVDANDEIRDMPANYGLPTTVPVISVNSALLAQNWYDLLDGAILNTLQGAGVIFTGPSDWWSGSNLNGSLNASCSGWTNPGATGTWGRSITSDSTWINFVTGSCSVASNLLCVAY